MNHLMPEVAFAPKVPWKTSNWATVHLQTKGLREVRMVVLVDFYLSKASAEVRR